MSKKVELEVGMTGTLHGMSRPQMIAFKEIGAWLRWQFKVTGFHSGLAIGADEQGMVEFHALGVRLVGHPPDDRSRLSRVAWELCDERRKPMPYMARNEAELAEIGLLVATPWRPERSQPRSGTWAVWRRAVAANKPRVQIDAAGSVLMEDMVQLWA